MSAYLLGIFMGLVTSSITSVCYFQCFNLNLNRFNTCLLFGRQYNKSHFLWNVATSGVGAPYQVGAPNRKYWIRHCGGTHGLCPSGSTRFFFWFKSTHTSFSHEYVPQQLSKSDLQAVKIRLGQSLRMFCFMYENSELSCWNFYNGS